MYLKVIFLLSFVVFLSACSGGGGSDSEKINVSHSEMSFSAGVDGISPSVETITVGVSNYDSTVYFAMYYTDNGIYNAEYSFIGENVEIYLFPRSPSSLGAGVYNDEVTIYACKDENCDEQLRGSPFVVTIEYTVGDGIGDGTDLDEDDDGVVDTEDAFPFDPDEYVDTDNDGIGNNADTDDDNDGVVDTNDPFPLDGEISVASSEITFNMTANAQLIINGNNIECLDSCVYIHDNAPDSALNVQVVPEAHFNLVDWGNSEHCKNANGLNCQFNPGNDTSLVFNFAFEEDPHFTINAEMSENGGFIQQLGDLQCENECELKLYEDISVILIPIPKPGYVFMGWEGDCDGIDNCSLTFATGETANISATFAESGNEFNICPSNVDDIIAGSGEDIIGAAGRFLPLCNGYVIFTQSIYDQVYVRDVINKQDIRAYQLAAEPYELELDELNKVLYVTHGTSIFFSRVDLVTGNVTQIPFSKGAQSVAVSDHGELFVKRNGYPDEVVLFDSKNMHIQKSLEVSGNYIDFNDATDRIITSTNNYYYNQENQTINEQGPSAGGGSGSDCDYVVVSPDGEHAAKPCGAGNGPGYSIYDFYSHDPTTVLGVWETGAYPSGAAFSPSSNYALLTNRREIQLFSTHTHKLVLEYDAPECAYGDTRNLAVSKDSKLLFSLTNCGGYGAYDETAIVTWYAYDTH